MGNTATRDKLISDQLAINSGKRPNGPIYNTYIPGKDFRPYCEPGKTAEETRLAILERKRKEQEDFGRRIDQSKLEKARRDEEYDYYKKRGYL